MGSSLEYVPTIIISDTSFYCICVFCLKVFCRIFILSLDQLSHLVGVVNNVLGFVDTVFCGGLSICHTHSLSLHFCPFLGGLFYFNSVFHSVSLEVVCSISILSILPLEFTTCILDVLWLAE